MIWKIRWMYYMAGNLCQMARWYFWNNSAYRVNLDLFRYRRDALRAGKKPDTDNKSDFDWSMR